ncbi:MAG: hypothetical protein JETCAE02_04870 [Anaerolineaceae bacterium]|jgi:hypothetical protein|nr:hypothetical protein [Anaerolineae bacterium]MBL1173193.1 hypothetical protein [Chloroflexota bacterium]MBV6467189.1 hypothetical protein [Anaerolineales bacterium]MCE7906504.1 hypothetical protein [Anaerolineae bacterium CFX3]MDL1926203.1 hypothetical protein [Anaerolineae bacterium AMX1]OQY81390.1 MAG: hypothetical protein B6D40_11065 [Anaerolineae bacterium UTCFX3]GER79280.1 conserved hypothetical protein [Candidatus Denitrolinea symbiosum]GJQ38075.1 MAG: hypothetical protein JETCAE02_
MFDGLRNDASDTSGFDDQPENPAPKVKPAPARRRKTSSKFLGMTAQQRFIVAVMLMFAVCSLGAMCLLITGRFAF